MSLNIIRCLHRKASLSLLRYPSQIRNNFVSLATARLHHTTASVESVFPLGKSRVLSVFQSKVCALTTMASHQENRLAQEKSPYLLQHKTNPVDWYPWGVEAFEKSKRENKLIFLSVGYSTCHWCHVMERESFENEAIAKIMNENFVNIKVDREERPDVDRIYMTFIQATQGGGGWPMSVFLTPDLKPITGGTYFPPTDQYGRPGFPAILKRISDVWKHQHADVQRQSTALMEALRSGVISTTDPDAQMPTEATFIQCYNSYAKKFDQAQGGFEGAPKFPSPVNFNFLFRASMLPDAKTKMPKAREMCYKTLDCMANGGIYDHIGFGFHRYSTDGNWHVPHFEKMLYDNAQLLSSYIEAFQLSKNPAYAEIARNIVEYISRDMTDPRGIYSAEDADSLPPDGTGHKKEGAFYVWTHDEIDKALSETVLTSTGQITRAEIFKRRFDVQKKGNVDPHQDPHDELRNQNVLIIRHSVHELAEHFGLSNQQVVDILEDSRKVLFDIRCRRPRPHLDDKMITAWNGLMLSGLSKAAQALQDESILSKAKQIASFVEQYLFNKEKEILLHSVYKSESAPSQINQPIEGFCEDYACFIRGLLDLYEASFRPEYLRWAFTLQRKQDELFWDTDDGGYFSSHSGDKTLLLRLKEESDGAEPSPNSVSLSNLLRLSLIFDNDDWKKKAVRMFLVFSDRFEKIPRAVPEMVSALMFHLHSPIQIVICGERRDPKIQEMIATVQRAYLPFKCSVLMDKENVEVLKPLMNDPATFVAAGSSDAASVHMCRNFACGAPIQDIKQLEKQLSQLV
ncbi:spermatogenesis-associated protein 20-like [Paramacrobiotus metropolitanus]|uniref:spermatogenesis-associated protein 20-like n=1 Tax=Paramacrobiotus metropolitanus TaxID=2943436 RepID=UPI0024465233|nr:spermatogenesis-associated protein 20-like [Paramacrobiotus metropolitanus]